MIAIPSQAVASRPTKTRITEVTYSEGTVSEMCTLLFYINCSTVVVYVLDSPAAWQKDAKTRENTQAQDAECRDMSNCISPGGRRAPTHTSVYNELV